VLIILTIGGTLFQFWGLILGVPVCTYLFGHAIRLEREA
jgi:predicted PurR-regulated permease PerM